MTQLQALSTQQLDAYKSRIDNAGTLEQKKAAAIAVYQELYDKGYNYAGWALGVATGKTLTGTAALDYLSGTALMGIGSQVCRNLSATQIDKIRVDMAGATLTQMIEEARNTGGVLTQDLAFSRVSLAHKTVFEDNGLSLSNWTLHTPMSLYRKTYGDEATERLWAQIRDTGGDGVDGALASTLLVTAIGKLAFTSTDPHVRQQAQIWMEQVPGTANPQALARSAVLVYKWLGGDSDGTMNITPSNIKDGSSQAAADIQLIQSVTKHLQTQANQSSNTPPPASLNTPSRDSAAFIRSTGAHTVQFNAGGGVDDLWVVENKAGRYQGTREQFRADFVASNQNVNPKTLNLVQNQTYSVPERLANGNTVYHYRNGATMVNNMSSGEYYMEVPNTDGNHGKTVYSCIDNGFSYTVKQVQTDATGLVRFTYLGQQLTLDAPITPVAASCTANNQTTTRNWLTAGVCQTNTYGAGGISFFSTPLSSTLSVGLSDYSLTDLKQRIAAEHQLHQLKQNGKLGQNSWHNFTTNTSRWLLSSEANSGSEFQSNQNTNVQLPSNWLSPIGAFYTSQSTTNDHAASIAHKTARAMNAHGQTIFAHQLAALDTNHDGQLTPNEAADVRLWADINEDGRIDNGELLNIHTPIKSADYHFYTRSNGRAAPAWMDTMPAAPFVNPPGMPAYIGVPASNHLHLRNQAIVFPTRDGFIEWRPNDIVLTWNRSQCDNLIGTEGNDNFDINYYASTPEVNQYLVHVKNFMAGGGDDTMGGSDRSDKLWGGTGNDTLFGYAGDDTLYGEEGDDKLHGQDGNDLLIGGAGNDILVSDNGDDVAWGDEGDDVLLGQEGNDQLIGGTGNDQLIGGAGNDNLWGGEGDDELQGNEGHDILIGESGNDRLFGQVGNDTLLGGDGDDVLVGFTPSNEDKQSLNADESDDDILSGGNGHDKLFGGVGNDQLMGEAGDDLLAGEDGHDKLWGGEGKDELQGGSGHDQLDGGADDDRLFGQVGNDTLYGGEGNDLLMGFSAFNETKQSLNADESDDDRLHGGAGSDILVGGLGQDQLFGGADRDELQGGDGDDLLFGEDGNDNLFGQVGNDILYGGNGDDYLQGFTASNETKQWLSDGESDNDFLYGGAGNDILVGGLGHDYLDGGAGADTMIGGQGDDVYIVNSVNDSIYEEEDEGYDTVITSSHYLLNANIEELRLLEGFNIHGTGNALNNKIIGNSADNILDGVTGADTLIGGAGNDTYYVDDAGDAVIELSGEGTDGVQSSINYTLGDHVENLVLLDFAKPEKGLVNGKAVLVYGYPKRNELDYMQGDAVENYAGTCALTSIANLLTQAGQPTTERQVVNLAINHNWAISNPNLPAHQLGGTNIFGQRNLLNRYGFRNNIVVGYNETGLANLLRSGRGVILAVNAGLLWDENEYVENGAVNHAVTLTGAVYNEEDGALAGFYLTDSGRGKVSDMTRFVDIAAFRQMANVPGAYAIYTIEPVKYWQENINGTGNALDNNIVGNRGNNILSGMAGNDLIEGKDGDDALYGGEGNDKLYGGMGEDLLAGEAGNDILAGGAGNDTYHFGRNSGVDTIIEDDATPGNQDTVKIQAGVQAEQIWFKRDENNLRISVIGTSDSLTIQDHYLGQAHRIERFELSDGKVLLDAQVEHLVNAMSGLTPPAAETTLPHDYQTALAPVIAASWK